MSSPTSCHSPASQSSYCTSVFSYNGSSYPHSPGDISNMTTPESSTPKEAYSPLTFASPSPSLISSTLPSPENMPGMAPLPPPSCTNNGFYSSSSTPRYAGHHGTMSSGSPSSSHSSLSQYPQEYYRPQPLAPLNTNVYSPETTIQQQQYNTYSAYGGSAPPAYTPSASPYSSHRRSLPPVDPTRFEDEVWYTPSGKRVRHSAMHLHCATM